MNYYKFNYMFRKKWFLIVFALIAGFFVLPEFVATAGELSAGGDGGHHSSEPALWSVIPFALLLLMIATGHLFYAHFWHKNYQQ